MNGSENFVTVACDGKVHFLETTGWGLVMTRYGVNEALIWLDFHWY